MIGNADRRIRGIAGSRPKELRGEVIPYVVGENPRFEGDSAASRKFPFEEYTPPPAMVPATPVA